MLRNYQKTRVQYAAEVLEVHGDNIEVIGTYKGARNTTEHKCNSCKNIWEAAPTNILKGKGEKHYVKVIT